jgi:Na+-driven multidrug efflux pump
MTTLQPLLAASEADATGIGASAALVGVVLLFGLFIGLAVNAVVSHHFVNVNRHNVSRIR